MGTQKFRICSILTKTVNLPKNFRKKDMLSFIQTIPKKILAESIRRLKNNLEAIAFFIKKQSPIETSSINENFTLPSSLHYIQDKIDREKTIKRADDVVEHKFDLLGSGEHTFTDNIPWHQDFISGYTWSLRYYKNINLIKKGVDYKIPWELSRFQHLLPLAEAYFLNKDEKYAWEFCYQINDWIHKNPYKKGINWASTMDVAIRAVNWIWAYQFLKDSLLLTENFKHRLFMSLYLHGRYIYKNLEVDKRGNHYISDLVGLICLGLFFSENKETKNWLEDGINRLYEEIEFQVNNGVHYEESTNYHRLVTELFISLVLIGPKNEIIIPKKILDNLEGMIEFVMHYTRPDGKAPIIGDADDGRLYNLADTEINDHRYLLNVGAVMFDRPDFKAAYPTFSEEAYWLMGDEGYKKFKDLPRVKESIKSKAYPEGGFYIMRKDNLYMLVRGGHSEEPGKTGHIHNDIFSFELFFKDKAFIIDPGTYVYASHPEWRKKFRGTAYHNTVVVDGEEQNTYNKGIFYLGLFTLKNFDAVSRLHEWKSTENFDFFDAEHYGYHKLRDPVTHRRQIYFDKKEGYWRITDILLADEEHLFEWYFHFAPMSVEKDKENPLVIRTNCEGENIELIPEEYPGGLNCEILEGWVSYGYGKKVKAPIVKYSYTKKEGQSLKVIYILRPIINRRS